jgi:aminoglycoside phosphotransferase (APT) family kinase protein
MMHENEIHTDAQLVRELLTEQFPQWARLPINRITHDGTDHALYRLGDDLIARLPRIDWAAGQAERDARWLPQLAPHLPVPVPVPLELGRPGCGYPMIWSIVAWLPGVNPTPATVDEVFARQLGEFVAALGAAPALDGPVITSGRGEPLAVRDAEVRDWIAELGDRVDGARLLAEWERALAVPAYTGPPRWLHGDLLTGNLLMQDGQLSAVIDFAGLGRADPAVDLMPAWGIFDARTREVFRAAAGYDDDAWERSRGWSLRMAVGALAYYWDTNPALVSTAWYKLGQLLGEP